MSDPAETAALTPALLARCETLVFDLDGTLYSDRSTAQRFLEAVLRRVGKPGLIQARSDALARLLAGHHPAVRLGEYIHPESYPSEPRSYDFATIRTQEPDPGSAGYVLLWDAWTAVFAVTLDLGAARDDYVASFHEARTALAAGELGAVSPAGLGEAIARLRRLGVRALLHTNSGEESGWPTLRYLALESAFDEYVFRADKPRGLTNRLATLVQDTRPDLIASIGDHFVNDIEPASRLGARTILVSPIAPPHDAGVQMWLHHPQDLASTLAAAAHVREGARSL